MIAYFIWVDYYLMDVGKYMNKCIMYLYTYIYIYF